MPRPPADPFGFLGAIDWDAVDEHADEIARIFMPVAVSDIENVAEDGSYQVVQRFETEEQAVAWLGQHPDQVKVERGGFALDVTTGEED